MKKLIVVVTTILLFLFVLTPVLYKFLSANNPVQSDVLVVEGWLFEFMMDEAIKEYHRGGYDLVITTGLSADAGRRKLLRRGVPPEKIVAAPVAWRGHMHRTFNGAHGLRMILRDSLPQVRSVNIYTSSVHGKKTFQIFTKVLDSSINLGIITCPRNSFDQNNLWREPFGIWVTMKFFIGWLYALVWNVEVR